jgi:NAD(P)-dependent dehydrogenase (short-subunit alcohol dehydrogenase family)
MAMKIRGAVALVTGANRGLGRAFAEALLAGGATVYAAARDPARLDVPGVRRLRLDVTRAEDIAAAARACGDVTLLVNNAGAMQRASFLAADAESAARSLLETNFFGTLALSRAFAPVLAANGGGAIVNVLSVLSWLNLPQAGAYGASKAAAWALTNGLRNELRAQGTRVVAVHAAFIDTDMARAVQAPKTPPAAVVAQVLGALEEGRDEVLADDITRNIKRGLGAEPASYIQGA